MCYSGTDTARINVSKSVAQRGEVLTRRAALISPFGGMGQYRAFIKQHGGLSAFGLDSDDPAEFDQNFKEMEKAFRKSGAFTDRALVPGESTGAGEFRAASGDRQKTSVADLKFLPRIPTR